MSSCSPAWRRRARRGARPLLAALACGLALLAGAATAQQSGDAADDAEEKKEEPAPDEKPEETPARTDSEMPAGVEVIRVIGADETRAIESEVAASVTQFDAETLKALGAQSVADLAKVTPNLEIKTAGATAPTFFIRGVGLNDFAANGSGAVAVYQDDVPRNAPALQLGQFFDLESVEVLKGPQGGGSGRNASAGAIRIVSRRPGDELEATLRSSIGNYNLRDFEGAIQAPLVEDQLSSRLAFRFTERDPILTNRCSRIPFLPPQPVNRPGLPFIPNASAARALAGQPLPSLDSRRDEAITTPGPGNRSTWNQVSFCGEQIYRQYPPPPLQVFPFGRSLSALPGDLDDKVNDIGNWSARGTVRYQPPGTDMDWLFSGHGSRLDAASTLGQAYGTFPNRFGGRTSLPYRDRDVVAVENSLRAQGLSGTDLDNALAQHLAEVGDRDPWEGDYDRTGNTTLDTWGGYARGDWNLANVTLTSITGYDQYDRYRNTDQDFTPDVLFESAIDDDAWQATQEFKANGELSELPLRWEAGGFTLIENLNAYQKQFFRGAGTALNPDRIDLDYKQEIYSWAGFAGFSWDFAPDFTLEAGARYNWERKTFDVNLIQVTSAVPPTSSNFTETWQSPTGTLTLMYRVLEDTSVYWKYSHGWKGGHFSALAQISKGVTVADPETIDAFEVGLKGNWLEGRIGFAAQLFYYDYRDYQVLTVEDSVTGPPGIAIINAHDAEIYGSEIEVRVEPIDSLIFTGRFGWLESQYLDFTNEIAQSVPGPNNTSKNLIVTVDYTGNRLINSPEFKWSGAVEYTADFGRYGALLPRFDFAWSDDTFFDPAEGRGNPNALGQQFLPRFAVGQPAFWILNGRLAYRTENGNFEIGGWVRNFLDTTYKTYGFDASQFSSVTINYYGEPRTYGMDFTVSF